MEKELEKKAEDQTSQAPSGSGDEQKDHDTTREGSQTHHEEDADFYKQEAEALRARLKKAEDKIVDMKRKNKSEEDEDIFDTQPKIDVEDIKHSVLSELRKDEREAYIARVAKNTDHAELIRFHLDNTIKQTGNIAEDVENAILHADKKRIFSEIESLRNLSLSKQTTGSQEASGYKKNLKEETSKYTPDEEAFLKKYGVKI